MESSCKSTGKWKNAEEMQLADKCWKRYSSSLKTIMNFKMRIISSQNHKNKCGETGLSIHSEMWEVI